MTIANKKEAREWHNSQPNEIKDIVDNMIWASIGYMEEEFNVELGICEDVAARMVRDAIIQHALNDEIYVPRNKKWEKVI